ncbi:probable glycosyltransferase At5g03795 isoform X1 [Coffea arabica]|uniref:Probable glycosyltransferase At5g03795 isoform X1 n=1 Tax=Coffea arabica TaxID=13443 RepID=A0A6P6U5Y1_COFAR
MDPGSQFICASHLKTRRSFWVLGITFGIFVAIQFSALPNSSTISSLFSAGKFTLFGRWDFEAKNQSDSRTAGNPKNTYLVKDSASSSTFEDSRNSKLDNSSPSVPEIFDSSASNKQIEEFSSSIAPHASSGSVPQQLTVAFPPAVSSPITTSQINMDLVSPAMSVQNHEKHIMKTDEKGSLMQRNVSLLRNNSSAGHGKSSLPTSAVYSISAMKKLLLQSQSLPRAVIVKWNSTADQELLYAKSQIQDAPVHRNSTELYAPLYRNVSMFKRSYELMDKVLKVYIYKEGEKPIFHESILEGIYASEGWFLKLMESNKQYATDDPAKAHLFYLPFSSRLLQLTLYVRHSHSRNNLIEYMKRYVGMLGQKYPFWNRTNGEDHFLAACHDWAPAETRGPMLSCLRALCNADINVGFEIGKDVALPTVYVRSAQNPLKDIGGKPPSQRPILAFFAGYMHGNVRPLLLDCWGKDPDMRIFGRMPHVKGNKNYIEHMKSSKYCICAKGYAVHSPRVVESIFYECVPVIISDNYVPPFFEVLNWESFAVFVLEKDIPKLKDILLSISEEKYLEMQKRVKEVQKHFLWHADPVKYDMFHMILHSVWYNRVFRIQSP